MATNRSTAGSAAVRALAVVLVGAMVLAACVNSGTDDDLSSVDVGAEGESDPSAEDSSSEADESDDRSAESESGNTQVPLSEPGVPDESFDYSVVDYDLEPAGDALRGDRVNVAYPPPVIEPSLIRSGGVLPDGIPPIDEPQFVSVSEADYLSDQEAVVAVEIDGDARAYPIQVLIWHEIVNDQFGDTPVTVTYCPLCSSALAFDRRLGERTLDFGTSGELYQSALVMYDRQTGSLWAHFTGQGLVGHYAGAELDFIPAQTLSWSQFQQIYPDGMVLTRNTGIDRPYGENPYVGYDDAAQGPIPQFFNGEVDQTLLAKARVVGVADESGSVAVRLEDLVEQPVIPITENGRNLVVLHQNGLNTALETRAIDGGRDIGQTGVFVATDEDGTALTFSAAGDGFVDDQTGSSWNIAGAATSGPLAGQQLESISHLDTFWFAWATYRPGTVIVDP